MGPLWLLLLSPVWGYVSVYSVRRLIKLRRLRRDGERVSATVASITWIESNYHRGGGRWDVRVRFGTRDGRVIEAAPPVKSAFTGLRSGQAITVAYEPADPERFAIIESSLQATGFVGGAVVGAVACVGSLLLGLGIV